ncbi:MAG: hypothetical protein QW041_02420 [Candidatus Pacearchaeota archaeon]
MTEDNRLLKTYEYWNLYLNYSQQYFGATYIKSKRIVSNISEFNESEWNESLLITKSVESILNHLVEGIRPEKINYRLDNTNIDGFFRIQIIPRYNGVFKFGGFDFGDDISIKYPRFDKNFKVPYNIRNRIYNLIRKKLGG